LRRYSVAVKNVTSQRTTFPAAPASNLAGPRPAGGVQAWRDASFAFATEDGRG